jgi:hypothetical protein
MTNGWKREKEMAGPCRCCSVALVLVLGNVSAASAADRDRAGERHPMVKLLRERMLAKGASPQ